MTETARQLGLERSHLYKKMKKYGINQLDITDPFVYTPGE